MGRQETEMLKGVLEGVVLAVLDARPAHGAEVAARLREEGFAGIAEGTVYAVLVRVEQRGLVQVDRVPSEKGPPRKVHSITPQGREHLEGFWSSWDALAGRIDGLRTQPHPAGERHRASHDAPHDAPHEGG